MTGENSSQKSVLGQMPGMILATLHLVTRSRILGLLGFLDIIDAEGEAQETLTPKKNVAEFYLSGVFSKEFAERERDYFKRTWESLSIVAPKVIAEAESYYNYWQKEWGDRDKSKPFSDQKCYKRWREINY